MGMSTADGLGSDARACGNCGVSVDGRYCGQCGQKAHIHRSLSAIGHDLAHGVLHIDGKIWNTLPLLFFKPGQLTRRYIAGERVKFLSPMGLYLFSVFLLFAVMALTPSNELPGVAIKEQGETSAPKAEGIGDVSVDFSSENDNDITIQREEKSEAESSWLELKAQKAFADREMLTYKIKSNGYKLAWVLIPLSLPFMWFVIIGRRGYHLYDHAVFVTYSISFMGLLASLSAVIGAIPLLEWVEPIVLVFIPPIHMFIHLKGSYSLGRIEAFLRLNLLLFSVTLVMALYLILLFFMGIL